jgi:acetyltransferase-like isoleucine patch superfamily enzyme
MSARLRLIQGVVRFLRGESAATPEINFLSADPRYSRFAIGEGSYGRPEVVYWDAGSRLIIGKYCSIAGGVTILLGGEHHTDFVTTYPFSLLIPDATGLPGYPHSKGDVVIGNDVWIGHNALILSGVTIGDGAVVGAGSVVTRDIEPYSISAGNPARHLRYRFPADTVAALQRMAWWDWSADAVSRARHLLQSGNVSAFLERYGPRTTSSS